MTQKLVPHEIRIRKWPSGWYLVEIGSPTGKLVGLACNTIEDAQREVARLLPTLEPSLFTYGPGKS